MDLQNLKINFLGDSITEGVGVSSLAHTYWQVLKDKALLLQARNYGISGTRIARQAKLSHDSSDRDFLSRVEELDADTDAIIVFGGTNDFGHGDAPLGSFSDRTPYTFYGACHMLTKALIDRFPHATIICMTPLHRCGEENPHGEGQKEKETAPLSVYVDILKEVARYYAVPVLDLFSVSGIQPCVPILRNLYCPDGLHPNDEGHRRIADRLYAFLRAL